MKFSLEPSFQLTALALAARRLFVFPIRLYQRFISPVLQADCRFYPSCSAYAIEAIMTHGIIKGGALAAWRLLRCNPWSRGGYDPVPSRKNGTILTLEPASSFPACDDDHAAGSPSPQLRSH